MSSTVLVTGGSGRLGGALIERLQREGWRVRALVHRTPVAGADEQCRGSVLDATACTEAAAGCDAVVHAAAVTHARSRRRYWETNVLGTEAIVTAATGAGVRRLLFVSSRAAVPSGGWYAESKLAAEQVVAGSHLDFTIVRLAEVFGAGGREGVDRLVAAVRGGRRVWVPGDGESMLCPLHLDDAAESCVAALRSDRATHSTLVVGGECITLHDLALRCIALAESPSTIASLPWPLVEAAAVLGRLFGPVFPDQVARLRAPKPRPSADLPFSPTPLDDTLRSALAER